MFGENRINGLTETRVEAAPEVVINDTVVASAMMPKSAVDEGYGSAW